VLILSAAYKPERWIKGVSPEQNVCLVFIHSPGTCSIDTGSVNC
jgi:hypothetical protein